MSQRTAIQAKLAKRLTPSSSYWRDIGWLSIGSGCAQGVTLLFMPLISRLYSPEAFGVASLYSGLLNFAGILASCRLEYFIQLPERDEDAYRLAVCVGAMGIGVCIVLTPVLWIFRDWIASLAGSADIGPYLGLLPFSAAVGTFAVAMQGWWQRKRNYRLSAMTNICSKIVAAATQACGSILPVPASGLVVAFATAPAAQIICLGNRHLALQAFGAISPKHLARVASDHIKRAMSLTAGHIMISGTGAIPTFYIAKHYGEAALGQFSLAYQLVCLPSALFGAAIGSVFYERAACQHRERGEFRTLFGSTVGRMFLVGVPLFAVIAAVGPWAMVKFLGHKWLQAGQISRILCIPAMLSFLSVPVDRSCLIVGAVWYVPTWHLARLLSTIVVAMIAHQLELSIRNFIELLAIQMGLMYIIDLVFQRHYSKLGARA